MRRSFAGVVIICLATLSAAMGAQEKGDAKQGKAVFEQCAMCHNAGSVDKKMGPGLKGLFKRARLASGKPMTDANVMERLNKGGGGMPSYAKLLTKEDKEHLLAYLKTL